MLFLDGKSFAGDQLVIALGVTRTGEKRLLGNEIEPLERAQS